MIKIILLIFLVILGIGGLFTAFYCGNEIDNDTQKLNKMFMGDEND